MATVSSIDPPKKDETAKEDSALLVDLCVSALVNKIGKSAESLSATFCYAGSVPLPQGGLHLFYLQSSDDTDQPKVLKLPSPPGKEEDILDLLSACEEATFGRKHEDVLDPTYRKALKLSSPFACNFNLSEYKILPEIHRVMAPDAKAIRAELHKLNIYRAGDFFKAHVDTPRGEDMFGSLVVCLPSAHEGGELHIRHGDTNSVIDWSKNSADEIQWVAFYSDCEHEVKEVTSKYRVTLTYNLFAEPESTPPGHPISSHAELRALPLYQTLSEALSQQSFMYGGGRLGFMCQHRYPHTSHTFVERPAALLKGGDAVLFAVARALGLHVRFVHLYKIRNQCDYEGELKKEDFEKWAAAQPGEDWDDEETVKAEEKASYEERQRNFGARKRPELPEALGKDGFVQAKTGQLETTETLRRNPDVYTARQEYIDYGQDGRTEAVLTPLSGVEFVNYAPDVCNGELFRGDFVSMDPKRQKDIVWCVPKSRFWDVGKFATATGNEATIETFYCAAAMLVTVPKWEERGGVAAE